MIYSLEKMLPSHLKEIREARIRVHEMDEIDGYVERFPSTILMAMVAGFNERMECFFDAAVMLEDFCNKYSNEEV